VSEGRECRDAEENRKEIAGALQSCTLVLGLQSSILLHAFINPRHHSGSGALCSQVSGESFLARHCLSRGRNANPKTISRTTDILFSPGSSGYFLTWLRQHHLLGYCLSALQRDSRSATTTKQRNQHLKPKHPKMNFLLHVLLLFLIPTTVLLASVYHTILAVMCGIYMIPSTAYWTLVLLLSLPSKTAQAATDLMSMILDLAESSLQVRVGLILLALVIGALSMIKAANPSMSTISPLVSTYLGLQLDKINNRFC